ncbi:MAG: PD40 domain-containing protein [Bacteroidales bacterium]|nr:PD40 domain-containing protein [Bacteroidales bacterium]
MARRTLYIIVTILFVGLLPLDTGAQQLSLYKVKRMSFNSGAFSEISPVIVKDGIIFCSSRRFSTLKDRTTYDGRRLYNIYITEQKDTSEWSNPKEIKSERSSLFNNGPLSIAADGKTVYFTSEVETGKVAKKKNFKNHLGIFVADLSGTDLTSLRPFRYNSTEYEVAHPSISSDGKYLFFASDMPGGIGGSDIWYCEFINNDWSAPVNLGADVNSPGSENYPYMHPSGRLYFTSSRPGGLGNLDVYYTSLYYGKWDAPVHLPSPINSAADDFAFVAGDNLQTGYFATNRENSDDIFRFASTIIRKASCDTLLENSFCFRFLEENAVKYDTIPFRYEWNFGDGDKANGAMVEHCYKGPGTYIVKLDVVNLITKEVLSDEKADTLVLTDFEQPYITVPDRIIAGQSIRLSAANTNLPGWNIAQYYWNFDDESADIGKEVDKTYMKPGRYNVQLIVTTEPEPGGMTREACVSKNINVLRQP